MVSVITVSRQTGSGGNHIAARVAEQLHYDLVDQRLIHEVAQAASVPESVVKRYDEKPENPILDFLRSMVVIRAPHTAFPISEIEPSDDLVIFSPPIEPRTYIPWGRDEYLRLVQMSIASLADAGRVVIVGRAAPAILKDRCDVFHIKTVAPLDFRLHMIMEEMSISEHEALETLRRIDKERTRYFKIHYNADWNDPLIYHLTINTGKTGIDRAVEMIVQAAQLF